MSVPTRAGAGPGVYGFGATGGEGGEGTAGRAAIGGATGAGGGCGHGGTSRFLRAQQLPDLVDHLLRVEGLVHVVVGAGILALGGVVRVVAAREEQQHRTGELRTDFLGDGVAVVSREGGIDHDDAGVFTELRHGAGAIGRGRDQEILTAEGYLQHFAHRCAVVDGE